VKKNFIIAVVSVAVLVILALGYFVVNSLLFSGKLLLFRILDNGSAIYESNETLPEIASPPEVLPASIMVKAKNGEYCDIAGMYQMISEQQQGSAEDDDNYFFSYLDLPNTRGVYLELMPNGTGYQTRFESSKEPFVWQYYISGNDATGILIKSLTGQPDEIWQLIEAKEGSTYFNITTPDGSEEKYGNSLERTLELKKQNSLLIVTDSSNTWIPLHKESVWSEIQHMNEDGSVSTLCGDMAALTIEERQEMMDSLYTARSINAVNTYGEIDRAITYTVYSIQDETINIYGASGENIVSHGEELILPIENGEYLIVITVVWKFDNDLFCDKYYFKYQPKSN